MARYKDVEGYRKLFDEEYKKTRKLISEGETHLDNLAEGFSEASRVIDCLPTADVVPKSEVEALKIELEAMRTAANAYKMHYEKAKSEVEQFPCVAYNKKHERYQVIHKGKDGRIFASKFHHTRKDAEIALAELKKKYTEEGGLYAMC